MSIFDDSDIKQHKIVSLDDYRKYEGDQYWYSDEDKVAAGTVRFIDGNMYYAVIREKLVFNLWGEKSETYVKWFPVNQKKKK